MLRLFAKHTPQPPESKTASPPQVTTAAESRPPVFKDGQGEVSADKSTPRPLIALPSCPYCFRRRYE